MGNLMKKLKPKHLLLTGYSSLHRHGLPRWIPFSRHWISQKIPVIHSPTWVTALALSAMIFSEQPDIQLEIEGQSSVSGTHP